MSIPSQATVLQFLNGGKPMLVTPASEFFESKPYADAVAKYYLSQCATALHSIGSQWVNAYKPIPAGSKPFLVSLLQGFEDATSVWWDNEQMAPLLDQILYQPHLSGTPLYDMVRDLYSRWVPYEVSGGENTALQTSTGAWAYGGWMPWTPADIATYTATLLG
jgi:hypothetical protein